MIPSSEKAENDLVIEVENEIKSESDVLALPPHKPIESKEKEDLSHYVPSLCFGATEFCSIFCSCCGLLIIIPLVLFLPLSYTIDNDNTKLGLRIATIVLCALGFLYFIYSIRTVFSAGLFCMPPPPPQTGPLLKPFEGEKKSYKLSVRRVAVIYNPYGGTKQGARIFDQIVSKHLKEKNIEIIAYKTEYAGHARDYSRTIALDGIDAIIVIGGDGTFHEAVNGLLKRADGKIVPIGIVPGGSGNSVMMDFGTWNPKTAIDRIISGDVCWIDVNHVKDDKHLDIYSINEVSWGIVGDVGVVAEDYRIFGPSRYDVCAIWLMLKKILRPIKLKYRIVGGAGTGAEWNEVSGEYLTAFINLTQHFGKGLRPAPRAKVDDGLMDLIFLNNADRGALLTIFQQIPKGSHVSNTDIQYIQTTEAIFRPLQDIGVINIDGEIIKYQGSIHISCHHKRLPIFLPPDCKGPSPSFPK